ncbi:hypothetical protein HAX54_039738 [Datura stramonium]|uniref:Core Histone H2A/H2B/H3 domain-containing protein n=1 Tax=Datura stramonium TaxID=4076 RepID=A0ABS8VLR2_DATST|nr:hypothetical protein [Datura stramonium]
MVMKEVNPGMTISSKAMTILDNFMVDMFERIAETAATLTKYVGRVTLTAAGIRCATKMVFPPGQLAKHAMTEGRKAIAFNNAETFFQPRRNVTYLDLFLSANDVALYGDVARDLKTERTSGAVEVVIKIRAKIRFKVGIWKSSHRKLKLLCSPRVPVSSTKSSQTSPCDLDL